MGKSNVSPAKPSATGSGTSANKWGGGAGGGGGGGGGGVAGGGAARSWAALEAESDDDDDGAVLGAVKAKKETSAPKPAAVSHTPRVRWDAEDEAPAAPKPTINTSSVGKLAAAAAVEDDAFEISDEEILDTVDIESEDDAGW